MLVCVCVQREPTRLAEVRVNTQTCVDGCYPYVPAPSYPFTGVTALATAADPLVETDECSNRGVCDSATGQCQCFTGSYGLACQHQTILV